MTHCLPNITHPSISLMSPSPRPWFRLHPSALLHLSPLGLLFLFNAVSHWSVPPILMAQLPFQLQGCSAQMEPGDQSPQGCRHGYPCFTWHPLLHPPCQAQPGEDGTNLSFPFCSWSVLFDFRFVLPVAQLSSYPFFTNPLTFSTSTATKPSQLFCSQAIHLDPII